MKEAEIIRELLEGDSDFRELYYEHRKLDDTVAEMEKKGLLTTDEEIELKRLKKKKLVLKDKMEAKIRSIRRKNTI